MANLEEIKTRFNDQISILKSNKGKNNQLFTREEYYSFLSKVKECNKKSSRRTPEEYQRLARYDIIKFGGVEKLIVPLKNETQPIIYYTFLEENFQIIHEIHIAVGHGGRNKMMKEIKKKYKNITIEIIMIYLNLCEPCKKKFTSPKKGLVNPVKTNSRCLVDLIDMQSQADGDYKFIMVYQDLQTKFVQLRALKTNRPEEVANHLLDIFTIFGAPCILESDNERIFAKKIVEEICIMWDELKIVHGKPRHSRTQGLVKRSHHGVKNMLSTWLEKKNTTKWSEAIKFIQFMKNQAHHPGIDRSPYEAMFGCKAKVGLKTHLPKDSLTEITTEEELEEILNEQYNIKGEDTENKDTENNDTENNNSVEMEIHDSTEDLEFIPVGDSAVSLMFS